MEQFLTKSRNYFFMIAFNNYDPGTAEDLLQIKTNTILQQFIQYHKQQKNIDTPRNNTGCQVSQWKCTIRNRLQALGKVRGANLDYIYNYTNNKDVYNLRTCITNRVWNLEECHDTNQ